MTGGCVHHPSRAPVGLCRVCASPVCAECHVRLDGILHCRGCLARTARALSETRSSSLPRIGTAIVALALLVPAYFGVRALIVGTGTLAGRVSRLRTVAPGGESTDDK